jgi:hypothetical protein
MFKMINQFGNKFECQESEVPRYLEVLATFENEAEKAKYEKTLPTEAKFETKEEKKTEEKKK